MTVQYACEGCGCEVVAMAIDFVPSHGLCLVCAWVCEHIPDPEMMMRYRMELNLVCDEVSLRYRPDGPPLLSHITP
jgi:hypothetical protein